MSPILPLIVSTEPLLRLGLRHFLHEHRMPRCLETDNAVDALRLFAEHAPGLVVIAGAEARVNVPRLVRDLRQRRRELPVLVLCRSLAAEQLSQCIESGGCACITSEDALAEVGVACASVLRGDLHVSRMLAPLVQRNFGGAQAARGHPQPAALKREIGLSEREQEVFELVGGGCGCKEIAGRLGISVKTVETHQSRIKGKLGVERSSELRRLAQERKRVCPA